jgi:hypothetical protein
MVMKIAAFEADPGAAQCAAELRAVLPDGPTRTTISDYRMEAAVDWSGSELPSARAQILGRHKDYARVAEVATMPLREDGTDPLQALLDA